MRCQPCAGVGGSLGQGDGLAVRAAALGREWTFPDRGHSLGVDSGRREVAETALDFLDRHGLSGRRPAPTF